LHIIDKKVLSIVIYKQWKQKYESGKNFLFLDTNSLERKKINVPLSARICHYFSTITQMMSFQKIKRACETIIVNNSKLFSISR